MRAVRYKVVLIASLAWLAPLPALAQLFGSSVSTGACSSGTGGNMINSKISVICGIPYEKFEEAVRERTRPLEERNASQSKLVILLEGNLDLNRRQIEEALEIVGERNVPRERVGAKLIEIAGRFRELQVPAPPQPGDTAEVAALKADVQKAIDAGDLAAADLLLANIEAEERQARDRRAVNAAETTARRGDIALTGLRYSEAAKHFANAAAAFSPGSANEDKRIGYLFAKPMLSTGREMNSATMPRWLWPSNATENCWRCLLVEGCHWTGRQPSTTSAMR